MYTKKLFLSAVIQTRKNKLSILRRLTAITAKSSTTSRPCVFITGTMPCSYAVMKLVASGSRYITSWRVITWSASSLHLLRCFCRREGKKSRQISVMLRLLPDVWLIMITHRSISQQNRMSRPRNISAWEMTTNLRLKRWSSRSSPSASGTTSGLTVQKAIGRRRI